MRIAILGRLGPDESLKQVNTSHFCAQFGGANGRTLASALKSNDL